MAPKQKVISVAILGILATAIFVASVSGIQSWDSHAEVSGSNPNTSVSLTTHASDTRSNQSSSQASRLRPVQTCLNNASMPSLVRSTARIALVKPVFTATPYSQYEGGSFYAFYHKYGNTKGNITANLGWLNTSVSSGMRYNSGWGLSHTLYQFLSSQSAMRCGLVIGKNVIILSDINVTENGLFRPNGSRIFDVAIVGFSEYVTLQEYLGYRNFVAKGGTLIIMDSDAFEVQVKYSPSNNFETLVKGHGWTFNGKSAWNGVFNPWQRNDTNWIGSTLCCFHKFVYNGAKVNNASTIGQLLLGKFHGNIFGSYKSHEENGVTNRTDTSIIAAFANTSSNLVAAYVHLYMHGSVICLCIFGDDIIANDQTAQYFLVQSVALLTRPSTNVMSIRNRSTYLDESVVVASPGTLLILIGIEAGMSCFMRREEMKKVRVRKFFIASSFLQR